MIRAAVLVVLYLAAGIALLVAVNADQQNVDIPSLVLLATAIALGWETGDLGRRGLVLWLLLPWILIALGLPFGTTNKFTGGDDLSPVTLMAVAPALASVVLMLLAAGARTLYERRRSAPPTAA
jgi:uncharacterized membrane protein